MNKLIIFLISSLASISCAFAEPAQKVAPVSDAVQLALNEQTKIAPQIQNEQETTDVESDTVATEEKPATPQEPVLAAASKVENESDAVFVTSQFKMVTQTQRDANEEQHLTIEANYPQIASDNLSPAAQQFNTIISNMVSQEINRFKKYVSSDMPHMKNLPEDLKHNSLRIDYDTDVVKPTNNAIISVRISIEGMQAGRAHPYHTNHVVNFDLSNGKTLSLADLFKPKANYIKVIADYCNKNLKQKLTDKWMIDGGTKPIERNFRNWNLEAEGIVITFDEYQVAPYVDGIQEVRIPYKFLKNLISPKAPIAECVTKPDACSVQEEKK